MIYDYWKPVADTGPDPRRRTRMRVLCGLALACGALVATAMAQEWPDRSRPPALGPAPRLDLPPIQTRTLSNGLPVWLIETHEVPLVQVSVVVRAGSGDDPPGKFGVASLTAAMLDEGAGTRSALEIADTVDFLGATLSTAATFDASTVRVSVPASRLHEALPVIANVALRPTFPEADLKRLRQERITSLLQVRDDPASIAALGFARIVFGNSHRYGTASSGTKATLQAFSPQDLRAFHSAFYRPSNAALVVVGDVSADAVLADLEQHFGGWKASAAVVRRSVPVAKQLTRGRVYIIDKPGAEQSEIRIGWVGVPRSTPDYFAIVVLNTVLGGSFTSRLNQNLREKNGYTYGALSAFDMRASAGPFVAAAGVQTDKTAAALAEFFGEFARIGTPVAADELAKARNYVSLGLPARFETSGDLSRRMEELFVYGLPEDYFDRYVANVQAVTADAVRDAAAEHIQAARFAVVVAGDREKIEADIRALKLAPVRVMTVEEALD